VKATLRLEHAAQVTTLGETHMIEGKDKADISDNMRRDRRRFLSTCGKFAAATPPAMALLLVASKNNYVVAASGDAGGSGRVLGPDDIPPNVHPGDTVCVRLPGGGVHCHGIPAGP
jgi:hypothetical protein